VTAEPAYEHGRGWIVSRYHHVTAVLHDPGFLVPAAEPADSGVAWLRGSVSRFTNGPEHARRREQVEEMLGGLDRAALRADAAARTHTVLDDAADGSVDVASALARPLPLAALAHALGLDGDPDEVARAVAVIARAYPPGTAAEREPPADAAVAQLLAQLGGRSETVVTQLTLLVQTCDATAGLIGNSVTIGLHLPEPPPGIDGLLAETLRHSPAVRNTRRMAGTNSKIGEATIEQGSTVVLDFDAANRDPELFDDPDRFDPARPERHLTFGHGFRACPAHDHAFALAAGVVETVLARCVATSDEIEYEPSPNLRVPASLLVSVR
jgi:cytochrome P450